VLTDVAFRESHEEAPRVGEGSSCGGGVRSFPIGLKALDVWTKSLEVGFAGGFATQP